MNYIDGANANDGLINPDRTPQPETNEFRKIIQNIRVKDVSGDGGRLRINNLFFFSNLEDIRMDWEVIRDGKPVQTGSVDELNVNPQDSAEVSIPINRELLAADGEYFLNIVFTTKIDLPFAGKGFGIASEQLLLKAGKPTLMASHDGKALSFTKGDIITITGKEISILVDSKTGSIISYVFRGSQLVSDPLQPVFWRVPTDNDEGGGDRGYATRWRKAGLDKYNAKVKSLDIRQQNDGSLQMNVASDLVFIGGKTMNLESTYTFRPDGSIGFDMDLELAGDFPPLARVGMQFAMPSSYDYIKWYGRGPFENYQDRKESAYVGLWSGAVSDQHFEYVMPQENGNKTDVRWLEITDDAGTGLRITGAPLFGANVQDYSQEALNIAKTGHSLYRGNKTYVHVDLRQMGLGGDDSWTPRVHEEYLLKDKNYKFGFTINPF